MTSTDVGGVKRRRLLRFGTLVTAFSGVSAISAIGATGASAAPGGKADPDAYVPVSEKGSAAGVATLDMNAKIPSPQLPDLSGLIAKDASVASKVAKGELAFNVLDYGAVGDYNAKTGAGTDDTAAIQAAITAAHNSLWGVVYMPPGKCFYVGKTLTIDARTTTLFGYRATINYTGTGPLFQVKGGGTIANQGGIVLQGLRLLGPGKDSPSAAIQLNTDDALTTLSYVAGHPFENLEIQDFGVGVKQANRAWGNTFRSCTISKCGTGFLVPPGLTSSQGERLAFEDCIISECGIGIDIASSHVDMQLSNCSLDYNGVAYKGNAHTVLNGGHVECAGEGAPGGQWVGLRGHFQHTGTVAHTVFNGVRFVITGAHTEVFEPYNDGSDFTDETSLDSFVFNQPTFSWGPAGPWGAFVSRQAGFPFKRYVNEANGRRGSRRGIFRNVGTSNDYRPYFGSSAVPSRTSTVALPTLTASVNAGDALVKGAEIFADQSGTKPLSAVTWSAPATATGTNTGYIRFRVYVGPDDVGKMFLADVRADITVTGSDSQRVGYINFKSQNDVTLMAAEAGMALTTVPAGTNAGLSLLPTYAQMKVPAGTHYVEVELQFTKLRAGDSITLYHPQVNVV